MIADDKFVDLLNTVKILCENDDSIKTACSKYHNLQVLREKDVQSLLTILAGLLLEKSETLVLAKHLPNTLPHLLAIALNVHSSTLTEWSVDQKKQYHEKCCVALGKLILVHPDTIKFMLTYFSANPAPFHNWDSSKTHYEPQAKKKRLTTSGSSVSDEELASCCLSFLKVMPDHFRDLWDWSIFMNRFLNHEKPLVRWLACECSSLVLLMCEEEKLTLMEKKLAHTEIITCSVQNSQLVTQVEQNHFLIGRDNFNLKEDVSKIGCDTLVSVGGVVLPIHSKTSVKSENSLVLVQSTLLNLKAVALGVATGRPLCLQGPVGCGKTSLVDYLACITGRTSAPSFLSVQLGDQTDSKMLLGTYQCTDIPGEFVWQPGVLTQAVVDGHWLLLEDIDTCSTDVAAVLSSLLETGTLNVPGYRDCVRAAPGFQLFLTQRLLPGATGFHKQHTGASNMLQKHWLPVQIEPLSQSELVKVVQTAYPALKTVANRIVDVFLLFSAGSHHSALNQDENVGTDSRKVSYFGSGSRLTSTRDLIKWCNRAVLGFDVASSDSALKVLQDAIDIFCCNVSNPVRRLTLAESTAAKLGVIHTKAEYFCNIHKPHISTSLSHVSAGRISVAKKQSDAGILNLSNKFTFSFTRPASALLERIACCIAQGEPVLLVGETGVGKTSSIQYLANQMGHTLSVINMNQQSDSMDLLGGYKPVELKYIVSPIRDEYESLFRKFFSVDDNANFLNHIAQCFSARRWTTLVSLMKHSAAAALKRLNNKENEITQSKRKGKGGKSQKVTSSACYKNDWLRLSVKLNKLEEQLKNSQNALAFAFVEGALIRAIQQGHWVLLDEINLANAQTLECLSGLLEGPSSSLALLERGDRNSIERHPDFRIFAAMNPATDVGKKELPPGIRNRFTEFFVDELTDRNDLLLLCGSYLSSLALPARRLDAIVKFYLAVCREAVTTLSDGIGQKPHYSLRTLCRALTVAAINPCGSIPRSLYEALLLSFLTQLDRSSHPMVERMVADAVMGKKNSDPKSLICQPIPDPIVKGQTFIKVENYWVAQGQLEPHTPEKYILTATVRRNLRDLVRVVSLARLPVLLQGETSVGKTSLITYLAEASGNRCLRVNNHEHTDLQEYIGCYAADEHGNLSFKEGVLVEAMRLGHWIILDELNLAPSDVLEALNRVLDDNRELFIPETQKVVKAHPNFMLFATQNPPGLYGGRKVLSRAFRNRFIELHFDEIPASELETIMHLRCDMPPSYCKKMVAVMSDLQMRRKGSAAFAGKQGFITLRDLFRWGERYRLAQQQTVDGQYYDWDQHIADEGYLILAGRVRKDEERVTIQECLRKHIKRSVDPHKLFSLSSETSSVTRSLLEKIIQHTPSGFEHIVWTFNIRRLAVLLGKACEFKEPILLVGETGCGKTTLCQLLAASHCQELATVNCHMHTESSDFLGGLRPVRDHSEENKGKLFEWVDGPLIGAMMKGGLFLADEISLADDSVLERLNSLLEPERKLLLAEKGTGVGGEPCEVVAKDGFIFVGTMNPGGDYGKKELSPALRNRFTEIWCEGCSLRTDLIAVIEHNLRSDLVFLNAQNEVSRVGEVLVDFLEWFSKTELGRRFARSIRDIMTWVDFINVCTGPDFGLDLGDAFIHGACLTFLDGLGSGVTSFCGERAVSTLRTEALKFLLSQVEKATARQSRSLDSFLSCDSGQSEVLASDDKFGIDPFYIQKGSHHQPLGTDFLLSAPTTRLNAVRVLRGLQLGKALLLEGSPGVGKTSLVAALARATGYKLTRINLSDQTDVSDLFGSDLPVEGGEGGHFAWRDGPFLQALRAGHWILLDELNLASQSVLEGLNAVLDHRGDLFIPELGRTFHIQPGRTRLFACQNPLNQGGARKGLPQSFLNRFTQVFMETLTSDDLKHVCIAQYPTLPEELVDSMVTFNQRVSQETEPGGKWGQRGSPWEMNLRDLTRWCQATVSGSANGSLNPGRFVQLIYVDRMRSTNDKEQIKSVYREIFGINYPLKEDMPRLYVTPETLYIGDVDLHRGNAGDPSTSLLVLRQQLPFLHSLARCVSLNWMSILVGPNGSGKTSLVHLLADLAGQELRTLSVNSSMDTTEILGGFEQTDYKRHMDELEVKAQKLIMLCVRCMLMAGREIEAKDVISTWTRFSHHKYLSVGAFETPMETEVEMFLSHIDELLGILTALPKDILTLEEQNQISELMKDTSKLKDNIVRDTSLNAGGKFEWVNSILVNSLLEGSWLLVDNVNLCSAAVLDRLNGLLEPQGALTIGERGVGLNGELITIHPHPNFRLFLAMDSRNGEISRAMRNRGIEIYISSSEEGVLSSLCALDRCALLKEMGVQSQSEQLLLLHIHEVMSGVTLGLDQPGLSELLHAAFLVVQQTRRGISLHPALLSACTKVYIQSRISDSADTKRRALSILEETINSVDEEMPLNLLDVLVSQATLRTKEVCSDSNLAIVKQRGSLITALGSLRSDAELAELEAFLGVPHAEVDSMSLLKHSVVAFYLTSSPTDMHLSHEWLSKATSNLTQHENICILSGALLKKLESACDLANEHLVWDRRWLPDVAAAIAVKSGINDHGVENRVSTLLFLTSLELFGNHSGTASNISKLRKVSVLDYSRAVHGGTLSDSLSDDPLLLVIGPLLDLSVKVLSNALSSIGVSLNNAEWWSTRRAILWLQRVLEHASSLYLGSDAKLVDESISHLSVQYRWLAKHTIPVVSHLLSETALNDSHSQNSLDNLLAAVPSDSGLMWKLAKRVRAEIGQPLPLLSHQEASFLIRISRLNSLLNLWPSEGKRHDVTPLLNFLFTSDGRQARLALAIAIKDLLTRNDITIISERLGQVEEKCSKANLSTDCAMDSEETEKLPSELNPEMSLWPFKELVCLNASNAVFSRLLDQEQGSLSQNADTMELVELMRLVPSIPASLVGFVDALNDDSAKQELPYAFVWRLLFATQSLAVTNIQKSDLKQDTFDCQKYLPQHCPILSSLASKLLFNQCSNSSELLVQASLNQHVSKTEMLKDLQSLLWRNATALSDSKCSYRVNEVKGAVTAVYHFIGTLEKSCKIAWEHLPSPLERVTAISRNIKPLLGSKLCSDLTMILLQLVNGLDTIEKNSTNDDNQLMQTGLTWTLLGCLESQIFCALPPIDPKTKHAIKLQHVNEEISEITCELHAFKMLSAVSGTEKNFIESHTHLSILQNHLSLLLEQRSSLNRHIAARPDPPLYGDLKKELHYYIGSIGSTSIVLNMIQRLTSARSGVLKTVQEASTWLMSQYRFRTMLERQFGVWYPDIVQPLLAANAKLCHGMEIVVTMNRKLTLQTISSVALSEFVSFLGRFPLLCREQPCVISAISTLSHKQSTDVLKQAALSVPERSSVPETQDQSAQEAYWLLKSALLEIKNLISISSFCDRKRWEVLLDICRSLVMLWEKQEFERRERELDKESLYKSRGSIRCKTLSEDEEIDLEISRMFPSSRSADFGDLEIEDTLDDSPEINAEPVDVDKLSGLLSEEDAALLCSLHTSLVQVHTKASWLEPVSVNPPAIQVDFLTPWLQRCAVAARIITSSSHALSDHIDKALFSSWMLAASLSSSNQTDLDESLSVSNKLCYDFYHSPNTDEVRQCYPVMKEVANRVEQLLTEWPEHPSLNQIIIVIKRISLFPVTSPLTRFLTGLEILLTKMKTWEENAHSGVSLVTMSASVTNLIIQWRRLELSCWKGCLNAAERRIISKASRWWFYLFGLVEAHQRKSDSDGTSPMKDIVSALEKFMELSPLGEYHFRLEMLLAFHCHVVNLPASQRQNELLVAFWNIHIFYSQFSENIKNRIAELKAPIEKNLKDYVKIARWNDINYWAVKETVMRTQRTLHKHVRDFEAALKQPSKFVLLTNRVEGQQQGPKLPSMLEPNIYVAVQDLKRFIEDESSTGKHDRSMTVVKRAESLFVRSRKLSKEIILGSTCPGSVATLNAFAGEIVESVQHLASLKVDDTLSKSKRVSQAKSQLQTKRKALADLFRTLQHIGLSYRTGLTYEDDFLFKFTTLPPLRLSSALKNVCSSEGIQLSSSDNALLAAWDGCDSYFVRSWARFAQLRLALQSPHKDNGPSNIERLKGFPSHLLVLSLDQHKTVGENLNLFLGIRVRLHQLTGLKDNLDERVPTQSLLRDWRNRLQSLLTNATMTLQQFRLLLDACPEKLGDSIPVISLNGEIPTAGFGVVKGDSCWQGLVTCVNHSLSKIKEAAEKVNYQSYCSQQGTFISATQYKEIHSSFQLVQTIANDLSTIRKRFESESLPHPAFQSILWLENQMTLESTDFLKQCSSNSGLIVDQCPPLDYLHSKVHGLMERVLLAIQSIYKTNTSPAELESSETFPENEETEEKDDPTDEVEDDFMELDEKHLMELLGSVQVTLSQLCMADINKDLEVVFTTLLSAVEKEKDVTTLNEFIRLALRSVPLLQQYLLLCQFAVEQQVSVLRSSFKLLSVVLAIFGDVATKGFCTPEDLIPPEEGEEGEGQSEGMGLGDGDGEKDVSNRIRSEDQLEGAHQEGQEKEEEDKECKEEQDAIEMSDNFESKHQDVEPKEDEEGQDEGEDEGEKEMGDTEKGADKLDEQIWGSDSEDEGSDDEAAEGKEEEEGNSGEQTGEKEMGAQEKESKTNDNNDEGSEGKEKEMKKPDINEMKDPDENDDQIDPYHGNQQPEIEPEPMDLPEELHLDDEEGKDEEGKDENPFDVDEMKEKLPSEPEKKPEESEKKNEEDKSNTHEDDLSDEDEPGDSEQQDTDVPQPDEDGPQPDENVEETEEGDQGNDGKKQDDVTDEPEEAKEPEEQDKERENYSVKDSNPTGEDAQISEETDRGSTAPKEAPETSGEQPTEEMPQDGDPGQEEREAIGQAPTSMQQQGHHDDRSGKRPKPDPTNQDSKADEEERQRPGHSEQQRSLGDVTEPVKKRLKTVDIKIAEENPDENTPEEEGAEKVEEDADLYQHIKDAKERSEKQTLDAATDEQADQQPVIAQEDEEAEAPDSEPMDLAEEEEDVNEDVNMEELKEELTSGKKKDKGREEKGKPVAPHDEERTPVEIEGEKVETLGAARGPDTTYHTRYEELGLPDVLNAAEVEEKIQTVRLELQNQLASWDHAPAGEEASRAWQALSSVTNALARDLSEQLRLVLEPTQAARLKGDFRTGRRINMRKVIPFIASQFRKDKIWMRRSKPSKREYQIVLAVDDSSSMADNRSKELAFESLALVSQALTLLEVGELGVLSFGETIKVLHKLGDSFTHQSGARLLQQFSFDQRKTQIGALMDFVSGLMVTSKVRTSADHAQLVVVVSDGRGVFSEGQDKVSSAIRQARLAGVFMVFVIIDNPENKDSILDIRTPMFSGGKLVGISSYMDSFPFPFYLILRDIANLPIVLSDALRQWFELVTSTVN